MAKRKLAELEKERGDLNTVIPPRVNEVGQAETARELGVSQFTISNWLKTNGYEMRIVYEKKGSAA